MDTIHTRCAAEPKIEPRAGRVFTSPALSPHGCKSKVGSMQRRFEKL